MKLIIDIPKEELELVKSDTQIDFLDAIHIISTIQNGTPLEEELRKLRLQIHNIEEPDHDFEGFFQCQDEAIEIISKAIDELKGE